MSWQWNVVCIQAFPLIYFNYAGCDPFILHRCIKIRIYTQYSCIWMTDWSHTATQRTKKSTVNRVASSFRSVKSSKSNNASNSFLVSDSLGSDRSMGIGECWPVFHYTLWHSLNLSIKLSTSVSHTIPNYNQDKEIASLDKGILVIALFLIPNHRQSVRWPWNHRAGGAQLRCSPEWDQPQVQEPEIPLTWKATIKTVL